VPDSPELELLGFSPRWEALFAAFASEATFVARVIKVNRGSVLVSSATGIARAKRSTALLKAARGPADLPAVGDWVVVTSPPELDVLLIDAVLERTSAITRGDPDDPTTVQVLAANIDIVFIVHPIDEAPNLHRIERELALAWGSGAVPVVVLTKADLSDDPEGARAAVEGVALGVDVEVTSAKEGVGVESLLGHVAGHRTAVLIGPSGAGKSTLVNSLLGEERQRTAEVRAADGRGRHTTVARELVPIPGGGLLIDTPGLRSLALTGSEEGISSAFPDIEEAAASCRFRDCTHDEEPGCGVRAAIEAGTIPQSRLDAYHKLMREAEVVAAKTDARLRAAEKGRDKAMGRTIKEYYKITGGKG